MPTQGFKASLVALWATIWFLVVSGGTTASVQAQHGCCGPSDHSGQHSRSDGGEAHREHQVVTTGQPSIFQRPPHGGQVISQDPYFFEVVFQPQATHVYLYGGLQEPISVELVRGEVVMQVSYAPQVFRYPLTYVTPSASSPGQNHLVATVDVSQVPDGQMTVTFKLDNLPKRQLRQATFSETFALTKPAPQVVVAPLMEADRAGVEQQQFCPVTGARLGSMGTPVKIRVNEQPFYVCCLGCVPKVRDNPGVYLGRLKGPEPDPTRGPSRVPQVVVAPLTEADRAGVAQQQFCPVTGARLGSMGTPVKILVNEQPLYVCCLGCVPKVRNNPGAYLGRLQGPEPDRWERKL